MPFSTSNRNRPWLTERTRSRRVRQKCSALLLGGICAVMTGAAVGQSPSPSRPAGIADKTLDVRVESILHRMTLEEKIGQLVQYSAGQPTGPGTGRSDYDDMI